jgi:histone acetyltransferase (RNA polymerase elongator complex component)
MFVKHYNIPVFIPELACPFQCVFCNQRKITGKQLVPDDEQIIRLIEDHLASFKEEQRHVEVGFFGGSFTGIPISEQARFLDLAQPFLKQGKINGIRLSTRPDYINEEILDLLKQKNVTTIELGAQSLDDAVLRASKRGHTAKQTEQSSEIILNYGFDLGLQMMIGLPGDTLDRAIFTAKRIVELGASNTRIYPTLVIRGTALHQWYKTGKYQPLAMEEAIQWTKKIIPIFEENKVKILRIGLHPSEGLLSGNELVAGPFHPSFKELVMTNIWSDLLNPLVKSHQSGKIEIRVPENEINFAIGYNAKNKMMLLKYFQQIKFIADNNITRRDNFQVL